MRVYQVYESYQGAGLITFATRELAEEFIKEHAATPKRLEILEINVIGKERANFCFGNNNPFDDLMYEFVNAETEEYRELIYKDIKELLK